MTDREVMQQALEALTESIDLITNEYVEAVELYSGYPSRLHRLTALKTALDAHNAAIDSLGSTIAQPEQTTLSQKTIEKLHKFLDASAGDGVISGGVDAADLYIEIFPENYAAGIAQPKDKI